MAALVSPPTSLALDLHLAKHDLWIKPITFPLYCPSANRGGAPYYLIKGAVSLPPTQLRVGRFCWQIYRHSPSDRQIIKARSPGESRLQPQLEPTEIWSQEAVFTSTGWPQAWTLDSPPKNKKKQTKQKIGSNPICEQMYSAWRHETCV